MAKREIVNRQVSIFIQSGDAQKVYDKLIAKQKAYNQELATATDPKRIDALKNKLAQLEEPISRAAKKLSGELSPSVKDVEATVRNLSNRLKRMSEQDADFSKVTQQYRQANKELEEQRGKVGLLSRAWRGFWQEARTVAVGVIIGNTIQSALQTVLGYVTGIVSGSAKIADELADIEKTTGLTAEEVKKINKELGKIDTRSSRSELRQLAVEAGKLGFESVQDVVKFVEAADKIRVALGDALGENAINDIAKVSKIFKVEMLNIASAINEVGNRSEASEAFAVDFLKRVAGTAPTVKLTAQEVLGLAAALEIAGQTTEVSSTALNTFFLDFVANVEKFGRVAGFKKGELSDILNVQGTNEAFLQFLERLKASSSTTSEFINKLRELGIDGARGSNVMLALANNIKTVREQQDIANDAIKDNSSVMGEFIKKNNNAAAELYKLRKNIAGLFQSEGLREAGAAAIRIMNGFVNVLKGIPEFVRDNRFALLTLAAGILLLNKAYIAAALATSRDTVAKILNTAAVKAGTFFTNLQVAAQAAYITVTSLLTGRITAATAAQRLWNVAMSIGAGPLGIILVAAGALVVTLGNLFSRTKQLTAEQRIQASLQQRISDATQDQITKTQLYIKIATDEKRTLKEKEQALDALIKQSPEFLKGLTLANIKTAEGQKILENYINSLKKTAEAQAKFQLFQEANRKRVDLLNTIRKNLPEVAGLGDEDLIKLINSEVSKVGSKVPSSAIRFGGVKVVDLKEVSDEIKLLGDQLQSVAVDKIEPTAESFDKLSDGIENTKEKSKKAKTELEKLSEDLQQIRDDLTISSFTGIDKEIAELEVKYGKLRERAKNNKKLLKEIEELYYIEKQQILDKFIKIEEQKLKEADAKRVEKAIDAQKKIQQRNAEILERTFDSINRDKLARKELDVLKSKGKKKLEAELALLKEQEKQELSAKNLTEGQKLLIEEKYRRLRKQKELDYFIGLVDLISGFAQQAFAIQQVFAQARTQKENDELERDRRINEKKKQNLDRRLKASVLTQLQYDRELQKIEKEQERREREVRIKQFRRDQRAQFVQALINNAGAVTKTLERFGPPIPPNFLGIAAMALTVGLGIAQLTTIASRKPPEFGRGGKLGGRSHAAGGNPIMDGYGNKIGEIEHDEGIINKFSMRDRKKYTVTGTPSQIASSINKLHGGVHWESGARLVPAWRNSKPMPMNFPAIHKYYASGGKFQNDTASNTQDNSSEQSKAVLMHLTAAVERLMEKIDKPIKAYTVITEHEIQQQRLNAIRDDATLKP